MTMGDAARVSELVRVLASKDATKVARALDQTPGLLNAQLDRSGRTALMWAAFHGRASIVELLLRRGANVNARTASGASAVWYAASKGKSEALLSLLCANADPTLGNTETDGRIRTPLHVAKEGRYLDCGRMIEDRLTLQDIVKLRVLIEHRRTAEAVIDSPLPTYLSSHHRTRASMPCVVLLADGGGVMVGGTSSACGGRAGDGVSTGGTSVIAREATSSSSSSSSSRGHDASRGAKGKHDDSRNQKGGRKRKRGCRNCAPEETQRMYADALKLVAAEFSREVFTEFRQLFNV